MSHTSTRTELENAKKFPWQWVAIMLLSAVVTLFGINNYSYQQRITALSMALSRKDSVIYDWQAKYINLSNELLYKNNIIDRQNQVISKTDSVARNKFEKPAKQIVRSHE